MLACMTKTLSTPAVAPRPLSPMLSAYTLLAQPMLDMSAKENINMFAACIGNDTMYGLHCNNSRTRFKRGKLLRHLTEHLKCRGCKAVCNGT
jgi:hypothetical protein